MAGRCGVVLIDRLEPCLFPENQASRLAASVGLAVATQVKVHCVWEPAPEPFAGDISGNRIAGLVGALRHLKPLTAPFEHLRHERHSVETTIPVEGREDFFLAANLNPITSRWCHRLSLIAERIHVSARIGWPMSGDGPLSLRIPTQRMKIRILIVRLIAPY